MTNPMALSDESLILKTGELVLDERRVSLSVLYHLRELDRRRLYAGLGFSSLYEYCTQVLGYSEASAQRRIQAARLLSQCPEIAPQIESGSLSLSVLSLAQSFFRKEEIRNVEEKRDILKKLENQSSRQAERRLLALSSEPAKHLPEKVRAVSETHSEVRFTAEAELMAEIEELKGLLGRCSLKEVIGYAVKVALNNKRPKTPRAPKLEEVPFVVSPRNPTPASVAPSRYIPIETRRFVWARDRGQCSYINSQTSRRCHSRFGLEIDHFKPYALGGGMEPENLALKCRAHNTWAAIQVFGHAKMARFIPSLG